MKIARMFRVMHPGANQQSLPAQMVMAVGTRAAPTYRKAARRRPRKAASLRKATPARRRRAATRRPARLVKGSVAAKRYMASIRRKRRR